MKKRLKNILFVSTIVIITFLLIYTLPLIPNFLRDKTEKDILKNSIIIFIIADLILIGIPAGIHFIYTKDYSKIKNVWFFAIFGGISGAFLGEIIPHGAGIILIIPYIILMFIYGQMYKRFVWWKVASTSYLAGIFLENVLNRAPIQSTTSMWIALFIYPYFATKIWENRKKISLMQIVKELKWPIFFSVFLLGITFYTKSPPLIFLAITFPFLIAIAYKLFTGKKRKNIPMIDTIKNLKLEIIFSTTLTISTIYITRNNISPPLIILGALLPFVISVVYKLIRRN